MSHLEGLRRLECSCIYVQLILLALTIALAVAGFVQAVLGQTPQRLQVDKKAAAALSDISDENKGMRLLPLRLDSLYQKGKVPLTDPLDAGWNKAPELIVKLAPQTDQEPKLSKPSIEQLKVRSLNNGVWIAFRLEWGDATADQIIRSDRFADGVAIEFPLKLEPLPDYRMGNEGKPVHLLLWRADRQWLKENGKKGKSFASENYPHAWSDGYAFELFESKESVSLIAERERYLAAKASKNPVLPGIAPIIEELKAETWNRVEVQPHQDATGFGIWKNGRWFVVMARPLETIDADDASLAQTESSLISFAVWDGVKENAGPRKMTTEGWIQLKLKPPESNVKKR